MPGTINPSVHSQDDAIDIGATVPASPAPPDIATQHNDAPDGDCIQESHAPQSDDEVPESDIIDPYYLRTPGSTTRASSPGNLSPYLCPTDNLLSLYIDSPSPSNLEVTAASYPAAAAESLSDYTTTPSPCVPAGAPGAVTFPAAADVPMLLLSPPEIATSPQPDSGDGNTDDVNV